MRDLAITDADVLLQRAMAVVHRPADLQQVLEEIPAPIYLTDEMGFVTFFNKSCVGFAGRIPEVAKDRWCVSWKLYTDEGDWLPHDACPMAATIQNKKKLRGLTAIAERPDGERVRFMPFPTPIFSESGEFKGAINMLIDVTEPGQAEDLRVQATRCRRLAGAAGDERVYKTLHRLASQYEVKAIALDLLLVPGARL